VFDHGAKVLYVGISERACEATLDAYLVKLNSFIGPKEKPYKLVKFRAYGKAEKGKERSLIYHTNVLLGVLGSHVIVCLEAIVNSKEKESVRRSIERSGKQVIDISYREMGEMCGNVMQVRNASGELCIIMSQRALNGFTKAHL